MCVPDFNGSIFWSARMVQEEKAWDDFFLTKHHNLYELFLELFPKMNRPLKGILKQRTKEADKNFDNIYC